MKRAFALLFLISALAAAPAARAQLGVPLPEVPAVGEVLGRTRDTLERPLQDVRRLQIRDLLRTHRRELEADPAGQPIVRSQILALGMSNTALEAARAQGFEIVRTDPIDEATSMVTLRTPQGMSTRRALRRLRETVPNGTYDFDHLHLESGAALTLPTFAQSGAASAGPRVGLIDSGVGANVAAQRAFASNAPVVGPHGTNVAALISSAAPGARIYAADIFGGAPTGGASSALARALGWLAQENVAVINVSLVGPRNRVVEAVIARMVARGFIIVAAVGNDGPAAAPLFPASYEGVVGVTGVDARDRVLIEAGRGAQVDFAALGVHGRTRGTSYAAPIIAARLATQLAAPNVTNAQNVVNAMRTQARDLGARGRDDVYGYGLIAAP
ncbi:S8 family serine peptidase [Vitreimonas flagellata]|uniref:S8 family serine peptidase n=1 Tax=Vitreimonas flagellata TaxID=2560861 RepID=UPI001074B309|nr:S8 family serine peptidase [Vitreimonas flagellata]